MNNQFILMAGGQGGGLSQIIMMVAIIAVFYFFMIRPQMKKQKETKKYIESLKVGDKVLTIGGIYGTIQKLNDDGTIIMAIEDGSKMKVSKSAVSQDCSSPLTQTA